MCSPFEPQLFYCGYNQTNCETDYDLFSFDTPTEGTGFILRGSQVAPLENGAPVAILVEPDTIITPYVY